MHRLRTPWIGPRARIPSGFARLLPALSVAAALLGCQRGAEDAEARRALDELAGEVRALRAEVRALSAQLERAPRASGADAAVAARPAPSRATTEDEAPVTLSFLVDPVDATVSVDGEPLDSYELTRPGSEEGLRVLIERRGYRSVEQWVPLTESRTLRYRLMRGRGFVRLPPAD